LNGSANDRPGFFIPDAVAATQTIRFFPVGNTAKIRRTDSMLPEGSREPHSTGPWSAVMPSITASRSPAGPFHRLKTGWQRGPTIDCALILLLVAFSTAQLLSIL
jgi:hypothetical protein